MQSEQQANKIDQIMRDYDKIQIVCNDLFFHPVFFPKEIENIRVIIFLWKSWMTDN